MKRCRASKKRPHWLAACVQIPCFRLASRRLQHLWHGSRMGRSQIANECFCVGVALGRYVVRLPIDSLAVASGALQDKTRTQVELVWWGSVCVCVCVRVWFLSQAFRRWSEFTVQGPSCLMSQLERSDFTEQFLWLMTNYVKLPESFST